MKLPKTNLMSESRSGAMISQGHSASCMRCQGLLVRVRFMDMLNSGSLWGLGWRCVNCGSIVDTVIRSNQRYDHSTQIHGKTKRRRTRKLIAA